MQDRVFDYVLLPEPRRFLFGLDPDERAEIDRRIEFLCADPYADGVRKFVFPSQVLILTVYDDGDWVIVYRLLENFVIQILGIERADPARRRRRRY